VAKARYCAVKIKTQWVVTPGKQTNKQQFTEPYTKKYVEAKFETQIRRLPTERGNTKKNIYVPLLHGRDCKRKHLS
jgi:hypothetical protein